MSGGTGGPEHTATRSAVLAARGYPADVVAGNGHRAAVVAGNGDGHQVDEVDELPTVEVEHQVDETSPAPRCALPGCDEPLPSGRRKYHAPACAAEAERRRARRKTQREAKKRQAARRARPSKPPRSSAPAPASSPAVDDRPRPDLVDLVAELLGTGAVAEVELEVDGALVVARAR